MIRKSILKARAAHEYAWLQQAGHHRRRKGADVKNIVFTHNDVKEIDQLLLGHSITKVAGDQLLLDNGTVLTFVGNMGCAGCTNGGYDLTELNGVDNIITSVGFVEMPDDASGLYQIFVYADNVMVNLATFEGGDGNGFYGTGYHIIMKGPS